MAWDMETSMPKGGAKMRGDAMAYLYVSVHNNIIALNKDGLLDMLKQEANKQKSKLSHDEKIIVNETYRSYKNEVCLPEAFVKEYSLHKSEAHHIWVEARKKSNFKLFEPALKKMVDLKRKQAQYIGYKDSPYDALLDQYEPGLTSIELTILFDDLKDFLVPFIREIKKSKKKMAKFKAADRFPKTEQVALNHLVCGKLGFDFNHGEIRESAHPFSLSLNPDDVRFTTRYDEKNMKDSFFSTIHELGHAFYEKGILSEHYGTPFGEYISLGIHESQSRFWENVVARSPEFAKFVFPYLKQAFPKVFAKRTPQDFFEIASTVMPGFIRVESDEVTYNMHIIVRFEIEKELIEGSIEAKDVPKIWKDKMKTYLGLDVKKDSLGALQDVHWSGGMMGYFPTYTLGNLYSLQFWNAMKKDIKDAERKIAKGDFTPLLAWLKEKIHMHGKRYTASALVKQVTGEELTSAYFINYLKEKYGKIYGFKPGK